jgi:hypothetical protein
VARIAYCIGALLFASGLAHLAVLIATGGAWQGPRSLRKPATFGLSFGLTLITIVWVASFIRLGRAARIVLLGMFMVGCVLETALISMQAWRGVPSHFNVETPFDASVTGFLAGGGVILVVVILTLTITAFRSNPRVPVSLTMGVRIGLLTLCASLTVGALMIAKGMTRGVETHAWCADARGPAAAALRVALDVHRLERAPPARRGLDRILCVCRDRGGRCGRQSCGTVVMMWRASGYLGSALSCRRWPPSSTGHGR